MYAVLRADEVYVGVTVGAHGVVDAISRIAVPRHAPQPVRAARRCRIEFDRLGIGEGAAVLGEEYLRTAPHDLAVAVYRASDDDHQAPVGRDGELRVPKVVSLLADQRQGLPPFAVARCEDAYLTLGIALRVENVGLALAEGAVVLPFETYERGEGAMRAVVPYLVHVVSDTLCHDARRTDGGGRHGDA